MDFIALCAKAIVGTLTVAICIVIVKSVFTSGGKNER